MTEQNKPNKCHNNCKCDFSFKLDENVFLHLFLNKKTIIEIVKVQKALFELLKGEKKNRMQWVTPQNLALVLRYLGKVPHLSFDYLEDIFQSTASKIKTKVISSTEISVLHDNKGNPRVVALSFKNFAAEYGKIVEWMDGQLQQGGFYTSENYSLPHITLARIDQDVEPFMTEVEELNKKITPVKIKLEEIILSTWNGNSDESFKFMKAFSLQTKPKIAKLDKENLLPEQLDPKVKSQDIIAQAVEKTKIDPLEVEKRIDEYKREGNLLIDKFSSFSDLENDNSQKE